MPVRGFSPGNESKMMDDASADALKLELMTFEEVAAALKDGFDTVLVPCGAIEQHGPHLPLCMDADHAEHLAVLIARDLGKTLIAPTIKVGCSSHHLALSGTISLRNETFEAVCQDYCTSLALHGFRRILLFSGHIGNFPVLADMLPRLIRATGGQARVAAYTDSQAWIGCWRHAVQAAGGDPENVGGHADIAETSLMLKLRPESVRIDRFVRGHLGALTPDQLDLMWKNGIVSVSRNGIVGDPHGSTVAIGEQCLHDVGGLLANFFRTMD
jgi:creatinine amidohydrolase